MGKRSLVHARIRLLFTASKVTDIYLVQNLRHLQQICTYNPRDIDK
jgi:hypothetical protein